MNEHLVMKVIDKKKYWLTNTYLSGIIKNAAKLSQSPKLILYISNDESNYIKLEATLSFSRKEKACRKKKKAQKKK